MNDPLFVVPTYRKARGFASLDQGAHHVFHCAIVLGKEPVLCAVSEQPALNRGRSGRRQNEDEKQTWIHKKPKSRH